MLGAMEKGSRQLLEQTAAGDQAALTELLHRHLPALRVFVRLRMSRDLRAREMSSDLVQSVCVQVLRQLDDFEYRGEKPFKAWLYNAALLKIKEKQRHHRAEKRTPNREVAATVTDAGSGELLAAYGTFLTASRQAIAREELDRVDAAFDQMPDDYREVISLSRIVGLSHAEIATQMKRNEGAVRTLLYRALIRLSTIRDREG